MKSGVCYVTMYFDIGRSNWKNNFVRSFDQYLNDFQPFINLFETDKCEDDIMLVFIDKHCEQQLIERIKRVSNGKPTSIKVMPIDNDFMNTLPMWKTMEHEREIMNSQELKTILGWRHVFPEHIYPEYTLINHCKIDLICNLIESNIITTDINYYAWVDFGFFKIKENIPVKLLDVNRFDLDKVNYTLINNIDERDRDIIYTLQVAPEKIGGFFFFGHKDLLKEYQGIYHKILYLFQNELRYADDDQHLSLRCYFEKPSLFSFHYTGGWHSVFKKYSK